MTKINKHVRFEDWLISDVDAFAGKHKVKDETNNYNFTDAIHNRYRELLEVEKKFEFASKDISTWKKYAETKNNTEAVYCEIMKEEITPAECRQCSENRFIAKCPKAKPLEKSSANALPVSQVDQGGAQ